MEAVMCVVVLVLPHLTPQPLFPDGEEIQIPLFSPWERFVAYRKRCKVEFKCPVGSGGSTETRRGAGVRGCEAANYLHEASACKGQKLEGLQPVGVTYLPVSVLWKAVPRI